MYYSLGVLVLTVISVTKSAVLHSVGLRYVDKLYHPISVIQEVLEPLPVVLKSDLVSSEQAYPTVLNLQPNHVRSLLYTNRDIRKGYASHIQNSNFAFTVPQSNLVESVSRSDSVQQFPPISYAVNAEPVSMRYTATPIIASATTKILTGPPLGTSDNSNALHPAYNSVVLDMLADTRKKAPLYTEAILKPWPSLK